MCSMQLSYGLGLNSASGLAAQLKNHLGAYFQKIQHSSHELVSLVSSEVKTMRQTSQLRHTYNNHLTHQQIAGLKALLLKLPSFEAKHTKPLLNLIAASGVLKPLHSNQSHEIESWVNTHLQDHCLRPKNVERQDMRTPSAIQEHKGPVLKALRALDQTQQIKPRLNASFDQLWILGAEEQSMTKRFEQAGQNLDSQNINLKDHQVSVRTGDRPLWPFAKYASNKGHIISNGEPACLRLVADFNHLDKNKLNEICQKHLTPKVIVSGKSDLIKQARLAIQKEIQDLKPHVYWPTEADLAKELFNKTKVQHDKFGELELNLISAEMKPDGTRPTTEDVEKLAAKNQTPGHKDVLVYSNQPHIARQELVLQNNAKKHNQDHSFTTCGPGVDAPHLGIAVDELARRFYEATKLGS